MTNILVTGSSGQLGQSIENLSRQYPDLTFHFRNRDQLDITNQKLLENTFDRTNFDYCINCAAYTNVEEAEKQPHIAEAVNSIAVAQLARLCETHKTVLIHISTDYVFDGLKQGGYTITDEPNPINVYGRTKLEGEKYIREIMKKFFIVRTSWLYSESGRNFYTTILEKARTEEIIYVTDEQKGCPTRAGNLAKYLLEIIKSSSQDFGIHHFSDGVVMSWFSFAEKIIRDKGLEAGTRVVKAKNYRTFAKRPANSVLL